MLLVSGWAKSRKAKGSFVTLADERWPEAQLYEKSYPRLHEEQSFPFARNAGESNGEQCSELPQEEQK